MVTKLANTYPSDKVRPFSWLRKSLCIKISLIYGSFYGVTSAANVLTSFTPICAVLFWKS